MKQAEPHDRSPTERRNPIPKDVAEYIADVPEHALSTFNKLRATIQSEVPPKATEIISYRMPAFKFKGKILVWYAAFSDHCSLFPGGTLTEAFKDELKGYKTSKGTIQFPLNKPLPIALVKKLVKARITETEKKKKH